MTSMPEPGGDQQRQALAIHCIYFFATLIMGYIVLAKVMGYGCRVPCCDVVLCAESLAPLLLHYLIS